MRGFAQSKTEGILMLKFSVEDDGELDNLQEQVEAEIGKIIYDLADEIYDVSQQMLMQRSHKTGNLARSENITYGNMWAMIGANTPYAKADHDGFPGHIQMVGSHNVREHMRTRGGKSFTVTAHVVGDFARWMPERTGKFWLDDAIKQVMMKQPKEIQDMIMITRQDGV
jgi:hypothetical protein